jgi:hypothetical protein
MARVPKITSPCPLRWAGPPQSGMAVKRAARIPVALGLGLAAIVAGSTSAADVASDVVVSPDSPYCDLPEYGDVLVGSTEAGEKLQWVDEAEAKLPDKADLPDIEVSTWLPTPKT